MVKRLLFLLPKKIELRLLRNAALITASLSLSVWFGVYWWTVFFACVTSIVFYFLLPERHTITTSFFFGFLIILWSSFILSSSDIASFVGAWGIIIWCIISIAIFLIALRLGSGSVNIQSTEYSFLNTILIFGVSFAVHLIAWNGTTLLLVFSTIVVGVCVSMLLYEYFRNSTYGILRGRVIAIALGLVSAELFVLLGFIPLGPWNAAAFITLVALLSRDVFVAHVRGLLQTSLVLRSATFFIIFSVVIFAAAQWSI